MSYKYIRPMVVFGLILSLAGCGKKSTSNPSATPAPTPKVSVNIIDVKNRPYVTLQPLTDRNMLEFVVHNLPKKADNVEVLLEYDRNKGVLDAVLKNFTLSQVPYVDKLFLGSKSSGGATTYHDDVIGGELTLTFAAGKDTYALQVPWRYDDTQPRYSQFATSDQRFQLTLNQPFKTPKVVVMQSPGLPAELPGTIIAGPYLVRGVGPLPETQGKLTIHLSEESQKAKLYGFNGQKWQELSATIDGRTLTATVPFIETYVVVK